MEIKIINAASNVTITNKHLKTDELSVALLCKYINFNNSKYKIISAEMIVPEYSPISACESSVNLFVEVL